MNPNAAVLLERDLQAMSGYTRRGDIERWLTAEGVKFFRGRNGQISTTLGLVEAAKIQAANHADIDFL